MPETAALQERVTCLEALLGLARSGRIVQSLATPGSFVVLKLSPSDAGDADRLLAAMRAELERGGCRAPVVAVLHGYDVQLGEGAAVAQLERERDLAVARGAEREALAQSRDAELTKAKDYLGTAAAARADAEAERDEARAALADTEREFGNAAALDGAETTAAKARRAMRAVRDFDQRWSAEVAHANRWAAKAREAEARATAAEADAVAMRNALADAREKLDHDSGCPADLDGSVPCDAECVVGVVSRATMVGAGSDFLDERDAAEQRAAAAETSLQEVKEAAREVLRTTAQPVLADDWLQARGRLVALVGSPLPLEVALLPPGAEVDPDDPTPTGAAPPAWGEHAQAIGEHTFAEFINGDEPTSHPDDAAPFLGMPVGVAPTLPPDTVVIRNVGAPPPAAEAEASFRVAQDRAKAGEPHRDVALGLLAETLPGPEPWVCNSCRAGDHGAHNFGPDNRGPCLMGRGSERCACSQANGTTPPSAEPKQEG